MLRSLHSRRKEDNGSPRPGVQEEVFTASAGLAALIPANESLIDTGGAVSVIQHRRHANPRRVDARLSPPDWTRALMGSHVPDRYGYNLGVPVWNFR